MAKILYVSPNSEIGGAEQMTFLLAKHARRFQPEFYLLSDGPLARQLEAIGVPCHIHGGERPRLKKPWTMFSAAQSLSRLCRSRDIAVIHSVMTYGHLIGGVASQLCGTPEVWFQHGPTGPLDWAAGRIPTRTLFVNSRYTLERQAKYRAWADRTRLVYCGIEDISPLSADSQQLEAARDFRAAHGISPDALVFGLMARISPLKGHGLFIEAAAEMLERFPEARFLIMGSAFLDSDRSFETEIRQKAEALGLAGKVIFTGFIPFPQYVALLACDVIVNSSISPEGFGLTLVEGMMLGRPTIAPDQGGPAEIITADENGLLYPMGNAPQLAAAMESLAAEPSRRAVLGNRAKVTATNRFSIERMVGEIEDEYDRLISK